MTKYIRLEIKTQDKMGITLKILGVIYDSKINLHSLEVFSEKICVMIEDIKKKEKLELIDDLEKIEDVISVRELELMGYEKNERKLKAIIDSVDEGVIALSGNLEIEFFNSYCEKLFGYEKNEILGRNIKSFIGKQSSLLELITSGKSYENVEVSISNEKVDGRYLATGRAVKDDNLNPIGSVLTIKDFQKAREIAEIVSLDESGPFKEIVGSSTPLERVKKICSSIAKSDSTVLIKGESGTGKELFAKAIKKLSKRENQRFITVNCAALPDSLIESELFGYEKGSFTGALNRGKEGLFKEADKGTIFLDEIGELSLGVQSKLLRVLQEGTIRKIGSSKEEKVDVRIICATNRNLDEMMKKGEFREDLYYRLNVIPITIPPLRERKEDIPLLIGHFIRKMNKKVGKDIVSASMDYINYMMEYDWPGNIRELENSIERSVNLCEGNILTNNYIFVDEKPNGNYNEEFLQYKETASLKEQVKELEIKILKKSLQKNKSIRKAAKELGISHTALIKKIQKLNIKLETKDTDGN